MAFFLLVSLRILACFLFSLHASSANPLCNKLYGVRIEFVHCLEALQSLQSLWHRSTAASALQAFSRQTDLAGKMNHMPQAFTWKTCAVGIDIADPVPIDGRLLSSWETLGRDVLLVLNTCVRQQGFGGRFHGDGFDIVIISPGAGLGHDTCLALPRAVGMSLGRCIALRAESKEQMSIAGMDQQQSLPLNVPNYAQPGPSSGQPGVPHPFMGHNMGQPPPLHPVPQYALPQRSIPQRLPLTTALLDHVAKVDALNLHCSPFPSVLPNLPQHPPQASPRPLPYSLPFRPPNLGPAPPPRPVGERYGKLPRPQRPGVRSLASPPPYRPVSENRAQANPMAEANPMGRDQLVGPPDPEITPDLRRISSSDWPFLSGPVSRLGPIGPKRREG